jgi:hypothetical protein
MFRKKLQFKVRWEGYGTEYDSWEYATEVHAPRLVKEFYQKNPTAPRFIRAAAFSSIPFRKVP